MEINVLSYQVVNGKSYDPIEINETIDKKDIRKLLQEYRNKVGSKKVEINGKIHHTPDVLFYYKEVGEEKKVQEKPKEVPSPEFKQTTKSVKELIRFHSLEKVE